MPADKDRTQPITQARLNRTLTHARPGRRFESLSGSRWGEMIHPAPAERRRRPDSGLRIVALASTKLGQATLQGLIDHETRNPGAIRLEGVCTDDAVETRARIGLHKRIWRFYAPQDRLDQTANLIETALQAGLSVYTGELKTSGFRAQLRAWAPDLILVTGCGQILDADLIATPRLGVINFHPSDLRAGHGAGAQPYQDLLDRGDPWTRWTLHHMVPQVDAGPIIGQSCPIHAGDALGRVTRTPDALFTRMATLLPALVDILLQAVLEQDAPVGPVDFVAALPPDLIRQMQHPLA